MRTDTYEDAMNNREADSRVTRDHQVAYVEGGPQPYDGDAISTYGLVGNMIENGMVEDGFDAETHGGGSIENVPGFDTYLPIIQGIGSSNAEPLPVGCETMTDAAHAHYQSTLQETVCGKDDRTQVTAVTSPPWRMIAKLVITAGNGSQYVGTGWFISPRTVMTAGHCVYSSRTGGWARSIEVIPAMDGRARPFGSAISRTFHSLNGWIQNEREEHDCGCIILPEDARLGDKTGWFGFANLPDAALNNLLVNTAGYPADKSVGTQWFNGGRITRVLAERIEYLMDTFGGQSGSAVWRQDAKTSERHVVAIHNYGGCDNKASRITASLYALMQQWKAMGA